MLQQCGGPAPNCRLRPRNPRRVPSTSYLFKNLGVWFPKLPQAIGFKVLRVIHFESPQASFHLLNLIGRTNTNNTGANCNELIDTKSVASCFDVQSLYQGCLMCCVPGKPGVLRVLTSTYAGNGTAGKLESSYCSVAKRLKGGGVSII